MLATLESTPFGHSAESFCAMRDFSLLSFAEDLWSPLMGSGGVGGAVMWCGHWLNFSPCYLFFLSREDKKAEPFSAKT